MISIDSTKATLTDSNTVYTWAEELPAFPGGESAMWRFIKKNIQYPDYEKEHEIQGTVYVSFTVEQDGRISDIKIMKSVPHAKNFDAEAIRIIDLMPKWSPGKVNGQTVRCTSLARVEFKLQ